MASLAFVNYAHRHCRHPSRPTAVACWAWHGYMVARITTKREERGGGGGAEAFVCEPPSGSTVVAPAAAGGPNGLSTILLTNNSSIPLVEAMYNACCGYGKPCCICYGSAQCTAKLKYCVS
jgi:hypothetical protein